MRRNRGEDGKFGEGDSTPAYKEQWPVWHLQYFSDLYPIVSRVLSTFTIAHLCLLKSSGKHVQRCKLRCGRNQVKGLGCGSTNEMLT